MNDIVGDIAEWLQSKGTTLWGAQYTVTSPDTQRLAALWFANEMENFQTWRLNKYRAWMGTDPRRWDVV